MQVRVDESAQPSLPPSGRFPLLVDVEEMNDEDEAPLDYSALGLPVRPIVSLSTQLKNEGYACIIFFISAPNFFFLVASLPLHLPPR